MPAYKTTTSKGGVDTTVSRQWAMRPDDERFVDLPSLYAHVNALAEASEVDEVNLYDAKVEAPDNDTLSVALPNGLVVTPSNWAFSQVCSRVGVPAKYAASIPAPLAALNLAYGFKAKGDMSAAYVQDEAKLRAMTSLKYGRILDRDVVRMVQEFTAGAGKNFKVPGERDWSTGYHNPSVDITKENTTLYGSDRDCFIFLAEDEHPIEIGKLPNGDPDLVFRAFYCWNSEVGARTFGVRRMLVRSVCCNRILWGVQDAVETVIRHTAGAPERFLAEIGPALVDFAETSPKPVLEFIAAAKAAKVAEEEAQLDLLVNKLGFSTKTAKAMLALHASDEGRPVEDRWDLAQAVTAYARTADHADARFEMETSAAKLVAA